MHTHLLVMVSTGRVTSPLTAFYYNKVLTDAEWESLDGGLSNWLALNPVHCWRLDQASITDLVGSADQTSMTGTVLSTSDSPLLVTALPFTPADLSGLVGWFDAADAASFTLLGSEVVTWADKSLNGYHCTTPETGARPSRSGSDLINGVQALGFSSAGGGDELQSPMPDTTKPFTVMAVVNPTLNGAYKQILGGETSGGALCWRVGPDEHMEFIHESEADLSHSSSALTGTSIVALTYSSAGVITHYVDGVVDGTSTNNVTFQSPRTTVIGRSFSWSEPYSGKIGEIIKYDRVLDAFERTALFDYLAAKWGL